MFLALLVVLTGLAAPASAAVPDKGSTIGDLPIAKVNPQVSDEVIESLPDVVQQSTVGIAPDYQPGTPIYYPNGKLVEGQSAEVMQAAVACSRSVIAPPGGAWSKADVCPTAIFGYPGFYKFYSWARSSDTMGCVQVRGYQYETTPVATWRSAGCGNFNNVEVYWGNVLGNPAARARSQAVVNGWVADWNA